MTHCSLQIRVVPQQHDLRLDGKGGGRHEREAHYRASFRECYGATTQTASSSTNIHYLVFTNSVVTCR